MVAFVGPSGAGKSTLFQLLLRFYYPGTGRIVDTGRYHQELTAHNLLYARLAALEFGDNEHESK